MNQSTIDFYYRFLKVSHRVSHFNIECFEVEFAPIFIIFIIFIYVSAGLGGFIILIIEDRIQYFY
jgi:hypothetical protein